MERYKVLIVDDDPGILNIYNIVLEKAGYDTTVLADGNALLTSQYQLPDVIVLDRQLSGIDGLDVCRHLKNDPLTRHIPVIMISASPDINIRSKEAGADNFIEKPFKTQDLLSMMAFYLQKENDKIAV
jgi:CheY-like chemotaxis protein